MTGGTVEESLTDSATVTLRNQPVRRRTIVKGAAWSIPVIAAAAAVPAHAASLAGNLVYNGVICVNGVLQLSFTLKNAAGAPISGSSVSLAFPDGIRVGGQSSYVGTTDTTGTLRFNIDPIAAGSYTVQSPGTNPGVFSVALPGTQTAGYVWSTTGTSIVDNAIPVGSTAIGYKFYLTPSGELHWAGMAAGQDSLYATNVTSAVAENINVTGSEDTVTYVTADGVTHEKSTTGADNTYLTLPSGTQAVGYKTYLTPNGDLYYGDKLVASGVVSAQAEWINAIGSEDTITYLTADGTAYRWSSVDPTSRVIQTGLSSGAKVVGYNTVLTPGGDLYYRGTLVSSNVTSANAEWIKVTNGTGGSEDTISYITSDGVPHRWSTTGPNGTEGAALPAGTQAVGYNVFLTPSGDLYYGNVFSNTNQLISSNVTSADGEWIAVANGTGGSEDTATYVKSTC